MPNEINKALEGLFQGGLSLYGGYLQNRNKEIANKDFTEGKQKLTSLWEQLMSRNQTLINSPTGQDETGNKIQDNRPQIQNNILDSYMEYQGRLQNNPQGEAYAKNLELYYTLMNKEPKRNYQTVTDGKGDVWRIDILNPSDKIKIVDNEDKKGKNTVADYQKMSADELLNLPQSELEDAFFVVPQGTQQELVQKVPALQQLYDKFYKEGDFAPKITGRGKSRSGFGRSFNPGDYTPGQLAEKYKDLSIDKLKQYKKSELERILNDDNAPDALKDDVQAVLDGEDAVDMREQYKWADTELGKFFAKAKSINDYNSAKKLVDDAYSWAGSLFNSGVDQEVIDYIYKTINETKASYGF